MDRHVASIAAFLYFVSASPLSTLDYLPFEYRDLIPTQVTEFITALSEGDKDVLKDLAKNYTSFKDEDEFVAALKEKSPELGEKAEKLHTMLKEKIDALGDEAKNFVKEIISEARKTHASLVAGNRLNFKELGDKAREFMDKFKSLSDEAKEDLQKQFPILTSIFKNEKFQKVADVLLAKD